MLERIVSFFERIAVALETIAGTITNAGGTKQAVPAPAATSAPLTPTGLAHNEGGANLVQQAQMPALAPAPAVGNMGATDFLAPAPPTTVAPPTREAVGNALIELATISRDKAVEVLAAFGGAQKLSQVPESEYPTLLLNINKTRAGLA